MVLESVLGEKGLEFDAYGSSPAIGIWPRPKNNQSATQLIYDALKNHPVSRNANLFSSFYYLKKTRPGINTCGYPIRVLVGIVVDELGILCFGQEQ